MNRTLIVLCVMGALGCTDIGRITAAHTEGEPDGGRDAGPPPPTGCVVTHGFWKNHEDVWPVSSLVLGTQTYNAAELDSLMSTPPRGDASRILAIQLVAAMLNVAAGASSTPAIADANAWLSLYSGKLPYGVPADSTAGQAAITIAAQLDLYNNGGVGPEHCRD